MRDDSLKSVRHERQSGRFSKSRGLSVSVSFLPLPLPPLLIAPFIASRTAQKRLLRRLTFENLTYRGVKENIEAQSMATASISARPCSVGSFSSRFDRLPEGKMTWKKMMSRWGKEAKTSPLIDNHVGYFNRVLRLVGLVKYQRFIWYKKF